VLVVNDKQPYKTLKELIDDAKKRPNGIVFSSSGLYGALHLPTALFMQAAGIQMRHLPTAGGGPALNAILGNNSQVLVSSIAAANAQAKVGKLRALACFSAKRAASMPDVPTLKELGYDVEYAVNRGIMVPKGTPADIKQKLGAACAAAAKEPAFKEAMAKVGTEVRYLDAAQYAAFLKKVDGETKEITQALGMLKRQ
jgi:tripartite-type tricarboxylate transporter receptor subunit TctC